MGRGRSGASRGGGGARTSQAPQTVTDNYGRTVQVVANVSDIPSDRTIWTSGGFSSNGDHYVVFAKINGYNVDTNSLMGVKVPLNVLSGVTGIAGRYSWTTSAEADRYIKRYTRSGASTRSVSRGLAKARAFSQAMKSLGL